jgi:hypothetical protein
MHFEKMKFTECAIMTAAILFLMMEEIIAQPNCSKRKLINYQIAISNFEVKRVNKFRKTHTLYAMQPNRRTR